MFIDMIRDIVKQVKQNPKQCPVVQIPTKYRQVSREESLIRFQGCFDGLRGVKKVLKRKTLI